ncbi:hypothetical protein KSC_105810 [Ktedonobacter sp. SOSP1-52]|nr:hypothetical protein KSC_105810 [Ktedonobacter sp. SOSP1-52]
MTWVSSLNGSSGWVVTLGPWSYDALHFPGFPPVLFLTLWLVLLTTVLLLGMNIVSRGGRPIFWARIWSWFCIGLSLVVLVTVAVASQGRFQFFPFLVMGVSLVVAGLGLFARHPDEWSEIVVIQPRISRRSLLSHLAGMAGLVAISGGVETWLVGQLQRGRTSRIAYTLPGTINDDSLYSYAAFAWTPQNTFVIAQYQADPAQNTPLDIWEIAPTTRHLGTAGPEFSYDGAAFAPNGRWLVVACSSASYDLTSFIWDLQTGASIPAAFQSPMISWSPDSSRLVGQDQNTLRGLVIWDVAHNRQLALYQVPEGDGIPRRVAWSPNGQWIVVQEFPNVTTVRLYEVQTGRLVWTQTVEPHYQTLDGEGVHIASLAWSPDSRYLALPLTFQEDPVTMYPVIIWDVVAQREVFSYTRHLGGANAVAWSPDGQYVASGGTLDATVQVWHAQTGNVVFTFRGHQESVSYQEPIVYVGWSPDGATIASADAHKVLVWDAPTR